MYEIKTKEGIYIKKKKKEKFLHELLPNTSFSHSTN